MVTGMNCQRTIDRRRILFKVVGAAGTVQALTPLARREARGKAKTTTFSNTINVMVKPHDRLVPVS
jgi:hypothetical protein